MDNKPRKKAIPRVALSARIYELIRGWRKQLNEKFPGMRISDGDLVDWALSKHDVGLSSEETKELEDLFFDEVKRLEWLLVQARAAKSAAKFSSPSGA